MPALADHLPGRLVPRVSWRARSKEAGTILPHVHVRAIAGSLRVVWAAGISARYNNFTGAW
jgi:hypothetical protein